MRKKSREVTDFDQMVSIIKSCDVCRLALNDERVPYILPLNFAVTVDGEQVTLWFHGASEGKKLDLIAKDPECSFEMDCSHKIVSDVSTMYCTMQYSSVIGQGTIRIATEEEKVAALQRINDNYHPGGFPVNVKSIPNTTVLRLDVKSMTGKSNVGKIKIPALPLGEKEQKYIDLVKRIESVLSGETDVVANLSNVAALIHSCFGFWWTGFYLVKGEELVLGPFQGPVACSRIKWGRGVCGTAWKESRTIVVPDVEEFPGHIACSSVSKSEIVVPIFDQEGRGRGVLDIDSAYLNTFDEVDAKYLEEICKLISHQVNL